ncbi:HEAT repeat domain-containing protein [Pendulispora rubella]|uniref:HEAT repeat domain-containing protein n=1 Tax=Pendulispora rubella TaxID=2741070 RepID=A0ABZ2L598_9BACT
MKPDSEFKEKLDALVLSIAAEGRAQVQKTITTVVNAGGVSESALRGIVCDRNRGTSLRLDACWLLARLGIESADDELEALMSDPSEQLREEAAVGLGLVSQGKAVDVLLKALEQDSSKPVRLAALHALGILSSPRPESAAAVMRVLQDSTEDDDTRADAAEALAHVKGEHIVDALIAALHDRSPLVRYSAAYALGEQGDRRALPALNEIASRDHTATPWGTVASRALDSIEGITNPNRCD